MCGIVSRSGRVRYTRIVDIMEIHKPSIKLEYAMTGISGFEGGTKEGCFSI